MNGEHPLSYPVCPEPLRPSIPCIGLASGSVVGLLYGRPPSDKCVWVCVCVGCVGCVCVCVGVCVGGGLIYLTGKVTS